MPTSTEIITGLQYDMSLISGALHTSHQPAYQFSYQFESAQPGDLSHGYTGWTAFGAGEKAALRGALSHIESFLNVSFNEVSGAGDPDLNLGKVDLSGSTAGLGGFNYSSSGGALVSYDNFAVFDNSINLASNHLWLILHELGHALGLKHSFDSDGGNGVLDPAYDNRKYTLMSYTDNPETSQNLGGFGLFDILALQDRWGANTSTNSGDSRYSGPRVTGVDVIWDSGGTDHLDASGLGSAVQLDLNAGSYSRFGAHDDVAIAFGVTLENASGGAGDDQLTGNEVDNLLSGGAGNDTLTGGAGRDSALFSSTSTAITVRALGDALQVTSDDGIDLIREVEVFQFADTSLSLAQMQALAAGITNVTLRGDGGDNTLRGGAGNDRLLGEGGNDALFGGAGNDTLNGGAGDDTLQGGDSTADLRDVIYGGAGQDVIDGGYGNDLIYGQDGNDVIAGGFGADDLQGQDGHDVITGGAFSDLIYGGAGNDFVNGGFGHDRINGGSGADRFYHLGIADHGSDWLQDYSAPEGDVLLFGDPGATADDFQVNFSHTSNAEGIRSGDQDVAEGFVIYKPSGQIIWALVDGAGQDQINLKIGGEVFDLLA